MRQRLGDGARVRKLVGARAVALIGGVLALFAMLANAPGVAIVIASLIVPAAVLVELPKRDLMENEPRWGAPAMLGWGLLVGVVVSAISAILLGRLWIEGAALHVGAAGFGGAAAEREGGAPFGWLLLGGVVIPAAAVALSAAGPFLLRRYPVFRNEVMDGVTLGAAAGGGFATGSTLVYVWPMVSGERTGDGSAADWTATLIGLLLTRPLIFSIATALVCMGLWHVALTGVSADLVLPVACGIGGAIVFAVGDLITQPSGTRPELLWHLVAATGLVFLARPFSRRAMAQDRQLLGQTGMRIVCPNCRSLTPPGLFCAVCGHQLTSAPVEADQDTPADSPTERFDIVVPVVEARPVIDAEPVEESPPPRP